MKTLKLTSQFKKDLKRYKHKDIVIAKLEEILKCLVNERPVPDENFPHKLNGDFKGYMECHVENDTLLIWLDQESDLIKLIRFGTHSELFGKGYKR